MAANMVATAMRLDEDTLQDEAEIMETLASGLRLLASCGAELELSATKLIAAVLWGMGYALRGTGKRCAKTAWLEAGVDLKAAEALTCRIMGLMGRLGMHHELEQSNLEEFWVATFPKAEVQSYLSKYNS